MFIAWLNRQIFFIFTQIQRLTDPLKEGNPMKTKLMMVGGAFITFFIAASLHAQAPQLLNYQGKLVIDGKPVQTTTEITFTIFNAATGGTALWTEKQIVQPNNGVFNVLLGSVNPLVNRLTNKGLFAEAGERYLAINVGNNPEIGKRIQITSVAYAIKATNADTARVAQMALAGGRTIDGNSLDAADGDPRDVVVVDNNGNVGIGTANPTDKLAVNGIVSMTGSEHRRFPVGTPFVDFSNDPTTDFDARIELTGDDALAINGANVGIGTSSPVFRLDISNATLGQVLGNTVDWFRMTGASSSVDQLRLFHRRHTNGTNWETAEIRIQKRVDFSDMHYISFKGNPGVAPTLEFGYDQNPQLTLSQNGSVGIKKAPDTQFTLDVNGPVRTTSFTPPSDLRYKKNIATIPNAIDKVTRLRGVSFDWRQEEFPELNFSKGRNLGFIAQEIKEVLPEVVSQDNKGYYSVAYSNVVPVLVEAIKEQQQTIAQLQTQVQTLQRAQDELESLKERMRRLEALLADAKTAKTDRSLKFFWSLQIGGITATGQ